MERSVSSGNSWHPGWLLQPDQVLVGNYKIIRMAGRPGGMGQVFEAEDLSLGLSVAIKVPALSIILAENGAKNFLKEARIAANVGPHPNVVLIRACLTDPNLMVADSNSDSEIAIPFIVMELLGGGNLAQRLTENGLPFDEASRLFEGMCSGVDCAHNCTYQRDGRVIRGVIHRDLKPENICFDSKDRLVVLDFGLARLLEDPSSSGGISGTPSYMAPEQWTPHEGIDQRTDIYALGIILFQMITGRLPFRGPIDEVMRAHLLQGPPDPRQLRPDLPADVAQAILKAMAKEKGARFDSAKDFSTAVTAGFKNVRATQSIPDLPTIRNTPNEHRLRGDSLARDGEYELAIAEYNHAIRINPHETLAIINRGFCWYKKKQFDLAIADYSQALQVDPKQPEAYNNRGMVWKEMGNYEKAAEDFKLALLFDPDHPLAPNNLSEVLRKMTSAL